VFCERKTQHIEDSRYVDLAVHAAAAMVVLIASDIAHHIPRASADQLIVGIALLGAGGCFAVA